MSPHVGREEVFLSTRKPPLFLLTLVLLVWIWMGIPPRDTRLTWILETFPFAIALPVLVVTYPAVSQTGTE